MISELSQRLMGSPDLYPYRGPTASINFITCHDGFTLMDMVSYNRKHNEANGENNNDGANDNNSWNCGIEGETSDKAINFLRRQQIKNALTILMVSQGIPMILMGDEMGRTKNGNNNTYCHDNELNWLNWKLLEQNADIFNYAQKIIHFRKAHPVLRNKEHFQHRDYKDAGLPDISFHGTRAWYADYSQNSRVLAFMLSGEHAKGGTITDQTL
jgi:glycogen operon protein